MQLELREKNLTLRVYVNRDNPDQFIAAKSKRSAARFIGIRLNKLIWLKHMEYLNGEFYEVEN